jgi:hypothetical protein
MNLFSVYPLLLVPHFSFLTSQLLMRIDVGMLFQRRKIKIPAFSSNHIDVRTRELLYNDSVISKVCLLALLWDVS